MKQVFALLIILLLLSTDAISQKEGYIWFFGTRAGIDFNPSFPPATRTDGALTTSEGCATISNGRGQLKFYTDGINVYNRLHTAMPDGFGLMGNPSSTQSGIIVPNPGDTNIYYIFTVDDVGGANGCRFTTIDMKLDAGKGDVVSGTKNIPLLQPSSEKITAVTHENGRDFWVITHKYYTDSFYAWLVDPTGISATVKSTSGTYHSAGLGLGYLKASSDGSKLGSALWSGLNKWEVHDFDNSTGVVSGGFSLAYSGVTSNYGIEFSASGRYLYGTSSSNNNVIQFDLDAGTPADIEATGQIVGTKGTASGLGCCQLAPDGKIYIARTSTSYLAAIHAPDSAGTFCRFEDTAINLMGRTVVWGLPTFIQSFFSPVNFDYINTCLGDTTWFTILGDTAAIDSVRWDFDDPSTGTYNTSTSLKAWHIFSDTGIYNVCVTRYDSSGYVDTTCQLIEIATGPTANLPEDTVLCVGETIFIDATTPGVSYLWTDSTTDTSYTISTPGIHWLRLTNRCGVDYDSMNVIYDPMLDPNLGNDTALCDGDVFNLDATDPETYGYSWSTGETTSGITVTGEGTYSVELNNACGTFSDEIIITYDQYPDFQFAIDEEVACIGDAIIFRASHPDGDYSWSTGSSDSFISVTTPGTYSVTVSNHCGNATDDVDAFFESCCLPGIPNAFSPNDDGENDEYGVITDYCVIDNFELKIYNRLGQIVFETTNSDEKWDGKVNGKDSDIGVYVYWMKYAISSYDQMGVLSPAEEIFKQGNLTLLR